MNLVVDFMSNWLECSNCHTVYEIMAHPGGVMTFWLRNVADNADVHPIGPICPNCGELLMPTKTAMLVTAKTQKTFSIPFPPSPLSAQN